jgi:hypothetical protein
VRKRVDGAFVHVQQSQAKRGEMRAAGGSRFGERRRITSADS